jgi:branched-chain amino acid transport system ATP-binding protein
MALLEMKNVKRHYGAVKAVDGVDLSVEQGEVRAVIGPNGAGKSTLFSMVAGRAKPTEGDVVFDGRSLSGVPPHRVVERGIGVTFQVARIFDGLTLHQNVLTAVLVHRKQIRSMLRRVSGMQDAHRKVDETLELVGLSHLSGEDCSVLSHGDRKALEIAIALASEPRLLLLDEPTAGMSVAERKSVVALLSRLGHEMGMTILFTEHDVDMVLNFADRITCMVRGRVLAEGTPAEIRGNEAVRAAYLGRSVQGDDDAA